MNRKSYSILIVVGVLLAATAGLLHKLQAELGKPGLRLAEIPVEVMDQNGEAYKTLPTSIDLPETILGYTSERRPVTKLEFEWLPKDTTYGRMRYLPIDPEPGEYWIEVMCTMMLKDRTSIHKPQYCLTGSGWSIDHTESIEIPITEPQPYSLRAKKLTLSKSIRLGDTDQNYRAVFIYWFVSEDQITADHLERMWWMARDLVTQKVLKRWSYVIYYSICPPGYEDKTYQNLQDFIIASVPRFQLTSGKSSGN
ncbi:MAG TPA: exosortase-associated EpsI family protein [Verrucomicrobiales bacterium]|jgi:hypothetical protein|nr:exosortase-associated EpsI family protein [Verrucomicrobiales bacterium]